MQTVPEDSGGVRVDDESWHPNVGDVLDVTVTLSAAVVANNDWGDLALDLPDGRSVIALNGTWSARLAQPDHWPPAAGQVWRVPLARPSVDGSTHVIWMVHWRDVIGRDPYLVMVNGFGEVTLPGKLLASCRELGTGLPELVPVDGGPGTVLALDIPEPVATVQHTRSAPAGQVSDEVLTTAAEAAAEAYADERGQAGAREAYDRVVRAAEQDGGTR